MGAKPRLKYSSEANGWVFLGFNKTHGLPAFNEKRFAGKSAAIVVFLSFLAIAISYELVVILYGNYEKVGLLDFFSYMLPSVAALMAGFGIYSESRASAFFILSGFVLILGFVCYAWSKAEGLPHIFTSSDGFKSIASLAASFLVVIAGVTLVAMDAARQRAKARATGRYVIVRWILLVVSLSVSPFYVYFMHSVNCFGKEQCSLHGLLLKLEEIPSILSEEKTESSAILRCRAVAHRSLEGYLGRLNTSSYCFSSSGCQGGYDLWNSSDAVELSCQKSALGQ